MVSLVGLNRCFQLLYSLPKIHRAADSFLAQRLSLPGLPAVSRLQLLVVLTACAADNALPALAEPSTSGGVFLEFLQLISPDPHPHPSKAF